MNVIRIENLSKVYKMGEEEIKALHDIYLTINEGEFVSIIGTSGSGKSTLLTILGCMSSQTEGEYFFEGVSLKNKNDDYYTNLRGNKIGYIFQEFNLLEQLTALENVMLPLIFKTNITSKEMRTKGLQCLDIVGLADRANHRPKELSGGQRQRVAVARSLVNNPSLIIGDEPTGNLDEKSTIQILALLQELNQQGRTIILVTHDDSVAEHSKRIIRINSGTIVADDINDNPKIAKFVNLDHLNHNLQIPEQNESTNFIKNYSQLASEVSSILNRDKFFEQSVGVLKESKELHGFLNSAYKGGFINKVDQTQIMGACQSKDWEIRQESVKNFRFLDPELAISCAQEVLSKETNSNVIYFTLSSLKFFKSKMIPKIAFQCFENSDSRVRSVTVTLVKNSIQCFDDLDKDIIQIIKTVYEKGLNDSDFRVQSNVLELIQENPTHMSEEVLKNLLIPFFNHANNRVLGTLIGVAWTHNVEKQKCLNLLQELSKSENILRNQAAIFASLEILKKSHEPLAAQVIFELLQNPNTLIQQSLKNLIKRFEKDQKINQDNKDFFFKYLDEKSQELLK